MDWIEVLARAYEEGIRAGLRGQSVVECPHNPATKAWVAWRQGWGLGVGNRRMEDEG